MITITRERLEQLANFRGAPVTRQEEQELARIALASLEAEPMFYVDGEAAKRLIKEHTRFATITNKPKKGATLPLYAAPPAPVVNAEPVAWQFKAVNGEWISISGTGKDQAVSEGCEIRQLYTTPPAPLVPDEIEPDSDNTYDYVDGWNACRAAMLQDNQRDLSQPIDPQVAKYEQIMLQAGNSPVTQDCWCHTCRPLTMNDMRFVVCPDCGNKRCPRANDHRNDCTGSNEPGQIGSVCLAAPTQTEG